MKTGAGFIMSESWMGESPYGAQGFINGFDELKFSLLADKDSINGAPICPAIAVVQLPQKIEDIARKFFWFRTYKEHFYQVIRLIPSNVRLYFESSHLMNKPNLIFSLFGIDSVNSIERFEFNFIRSGIALLTLFARSAVLDNDQIKGIVYQDVWLDKDCVVAPDGTIHFADIEGLIWKSVPRDQFTKTQLSEWEKLVFEFLYALVKIDSYRHEIEDSNYSWTKQRQELGVLIELSLNEDKFTYCKNEGENLVIVVENSIFPKIEIPILEKVN